MSNISLPTDRRFTITIEALHTARTAINVLRPNSSFTGGGLSDKSSRLPRLGAKKSSTLPYIPAGSLRGGLRRALIHRIVDACKQQGNPLNIDDLYLLIEGVDTTNSKVKESASGRLDREDKLRQANPFLSFWGMWQLTGHFSPSELIPTSDDCIFVDAGARTNHFTATPTDVKWLNEEDIQKLETYAAEDQLASAEAEPVKKLIDELKLQRRNVKDKDELAKIDREIEVQNANLKAISDAKSGSATSIQRPLDGSELFKPGTQFTQSITLQNINHIELGLFIQTIADFAKAPVVGGKRNITPGLISSHLVLKFWGLDSDSPDEIGHISFDANGFELKDLTHSEQLKAARTSFNSSVDQFNYKSFLLSDYD